jgi:hypothetical protein
VEVLVLSGSLTSLWPDSFGLFACLDFGPCPLFFFLSLAWVLSFYKVWQGFITCLLFSEGHLPCSKVSNPGAEYKPVSGGFFFCQEPLVPTILKKRKLTQFWFQFYKEMEPGVWFFQRDLLPFAFQF